MSKIVVASSHLSMIFPQHREFLEVLKNRNSGEYSDTLEAAVARMAAEMEVGILKRDCANENTVCLLIGKNGIDIDEYKSYIPIGSSLRWNQNYDSNGDIAAVEAICYKQLSKKYPSDEAFREYCTHLNHLLPDEWVYPGIFWAWPRDVLRPVVSDLLATVELMENKPTVELLLVIRGKIDGIGAKTDAILSEVISHARE